MSPVVVVRRRPVRAALLAGALAAAVAAPSPAAERGGVVIFDGPPPPPAALARILWPERAAAAPPRTRSIRLLDEGGEGRQAPAEGAGPDAFAFLVRFRFDSADILPESLPYLDSVGAMLRLPEAEGRRVAVVGHADATGPDAYNQQLSERRAAAVAAYLRERHGIAPGRVTAAGRGEREPLPGLEPTAARNRRVEFRAAEG